MIPSSRSGTPLRRLLAVATAAIVPAIAGCGAGAGQLNAPDPQWHQPNPGASATVSGTIEINDMFVLASASGSSLPVGGSAGVFLALTNTGAADRLVSASAPGAAASVQLPSGGVKLGTDQSALLTGQVPRIVLKDLTKRLSGGQYVRIVLHFANAGSVTVDAPVMPRSGDYASFSPAPTPSPSRILSATPTPFPGASRTAAPRATPTPDSSSTASPAGNS